MTCERLLKVLTGAPVVPTAGAIPAHAAQVADHGVKKDGVVIQASFHSIDNLSLGAEVCVSPG